MRRAPLSLGLFAIAIGVAGLAGCRQGAPWPHAGEAHGRYVGVGIYTPTAEWRRLLTDQQPTAPGAAQRRDDQVIVVTTDSTTGELRACGDLSGYCIGLNPWKRPLGARQMSPVPVSAHDAGDAAMNDADNAVAAANAP
jgi:hypothetical protein